VRRFKKDEVPEETLEKILEAGRWAMSGANAQPWEFVVVRDAEMRAKVVDSWPAPNQEAYVIEQTRVPEVRQPPPARAPHRSQLQGRPGADSHGGRPPHLQAPRWLPAS